MQETTAETDMPSLETGINHLETDVDGAVHALTVSHLIIRGGRARWVDARNRASTHTFHRIAPTDRFLDRVDVARAFTPHQHLALVEQLRDAAAQDDTVLVLPAIDHLYTSNDLLDGEGRSMLGRALALLDRVAWRRQLPVLLTTHTDRFTGLVANRAARTVRCRMTDHGARFSAPRFETLVYPGTGAAQTTLALWRQTLKRQYATARQCHG